MRFRHVLSRVVVASALGRTASLAAMMLLARGLSPAELGEFVLLVGLALPVATVASFGFPTSITRRAAERTATNRPIKPLAGAVSRASRRASVGLTAFTLVCTCAFLVLRPDDLFSPIVVGLLSTAAVRVLLDGALLNGVSRPELSTQVSAARQMLWLLVVILGVWIGADLVHALVAVVLVDICYSAALRIVVRRVVGRYEEDVHVLHEVRHLRAVAIPAYISSLASSVALWVSQASLARWASLEELAVFGVAQRWTQAVLFVVAAVSPAVLPWMTQAYSAGGTHAVRSVLAKTGLLVLITCCVPAIALSFAARPVMSISGDSYEGGSPVLVIQSIGAIAVALNAIASQLAIAVMRTRLWLVSDLLLASFLLVGSLALGLAGRMTAESASVVLAGAYAVSVICVVIGLRFFRPQLKAST